MTAQAKNNEENLEEEEIETPLPIKKTVSEKQYKHLAHARKMKAAKHNLKEKNKEILYDRLTDIFNQLGTLSTQMGTIVTNLHHESHVTGVKRKMEEAIVENEPDKKKLKENEEIMEKAEKIQIDPKHTHWMASHGELIIRAVGGLVSIGMLYFYRNLQEKNKNAHPANYLYKDIV